MKVLKKQMEAREGKLVELERNAEKLQVGYNVLSKSLDQVSVQDLLDNEKMVEMTQKLNQIVKSVLPEQMILSPKSPSLQGQQVNLEKTVCLKNYDVPGNPWGLAVGRDGVLYVSLWCTGEVAMFDKSRKLIQKFGRLSSPTGIATEKESGNVIVCDNTSSKLQVFTRNGVFMWEIPTRGNPMGVVVDSKGRIIVTQQTTHSISIFDKQGKLISDFGSGGNQILQFLNPSGVSVDSQDSMYISDYGNARIQVFNSQVQFLRVVTGRETFQLSDPFASTFFRGILLVCDSLQRVVSLDLIQSSFGGPKQFSSPRGIAIDSQGFIVVSDFDKKRFTVFQYN